MTNTSRGRNAPAAKGFEVTPELEAYLKAKQADPDAELTEGAKKALDRLTDEDLAGFAKQVSVRMGKPVALTPEQNAAFRASGGDQPEVTRKGPPSKLPYKAPAGRFSGAGAGDSKWLGLGSLKDEWEAFEGSWEAFKKRATEDDPDWMRPTPHKWAVVVRIGAPLTDKMAQKISGVFEDQEAALAHAQVVRDYWRYFETDVVTMHTFMPYPTSEDVKRGVMRVYDDPTLDAVMQEHFKQGAESKGKQVDRINEALERARDPHKFEAEDAARRERGDPEDFPPLEFIPNAVDDKNCGVFDDVRCQ